LAPEDGEPILAGLGRYGPYVQHGKIYASLGSIEEAFEVGLNRAVTLLAEKRAGGARGARGGAAPALKELGEHPATGKPVRILSGRFGPYIKHEDVNANVPRGKDPQAVTLDEAVALLAERAGKAPSTKAPTRKPAAKVKPAAADAPTKPAAKPPAKAKSAAKAPPARSKASPAPLAKKPASKSAKKA
jgi:DNA topoisomerase-1